MIAPGNHLDFDSLRGAPPRGEALPIPEGAEPDWDNLDWAALTQSAG